MEEIYESENGRFFLFCNIKDVEENCSQVIRLDELNGKRGFCFGYIEGVSLYNLKVKRPLYEVTVQDLEGRTIRGRAIYNEEELSAILSSNSNEKYNLTFYINKDSTASLLEILCIEKDEGDHEDSEELTILIPSGVYS